MRLPQEALLQILQLLRRWDLALLSIVNRPLESRVSGFASELALRCIDGAWVHGPVPGRKNSVDHSMSANSVKAIAQYAPPINLGRLRIQNAGLSALSRQSCFELVFSFKTLDL
ncbi:hypothetical protein AAVH_16522 [Aphelenchoides avenae]|nr:hypothetical protein AAVH_16522 [Aphelenchus avenae]